MTICAVVLQDESALSYRCEARRRFDACWKEASFMRTKEFMTARWCLFTLHSAHDDLRMFLAGRDCSVAAFLDKEEVRSVFD